MPDLVGVLRQRDALDLASALAVEQAQLDPGGVGREQGEVDAAPSQVAPKGCGQPGETAQRAPAMVRLTRPNGRARKQPATTLKNAFPQRSLLVARGRPDGAIMNKKGFRSSAT